MSHVIEGDLELPRLVFGSHVRFPGGQGYRVLGRSESLSHDEAYCMERACRLWGTWAVPGVSVPQIGTLYHLPTARVLSSGSSQTTESTVVVRGKPIGRDWSERPNAMVFEAVLLTASQFATLDYQAFGLRRCRALLQSLDDVRDPLPPLRVTLADAGAPAIPPFPGWQADVLAAELSHLLGGGDVIYESSDPDTRLEEHLRLLHLGLPVALRSEAGFATLLERRTDDLGALDSSPNAGATMGRPASRFCITGVYGPRPLQLGRTRSLRAAVRPAAGTASAIERYVEAYRAFVEAGELAGILEIGRLGIESDTAEDDPDATKRGWTRWLR